MTQKERAQYEDFESRSQKTLDQYYASRGHTVDRSNACFQYDCIIDGKWKIEEKFRSVSRPDIAIEFIQNMQAGKFNLGWFYETKCDYLHYVFMDGERIDRFLRINWLKFRDWIIDTYFSKVNQHPFSVVSPKGYGVTLNLCVRIDQIPEQILILDEKPKLHKFSKGANYEP
jgi:hypothetical protein